MIIGIPKELKEEEYRVGITPDWAQVLVQQGHRVLLEQGAGVGSGYRDEAYQKVGVQVVAEGAAIYHESDLVLKVKEPLSAEYPLFHPGLLLFCFLHLAAEEPLTRALMAHQVTGIAYETVETADGRLPLLAPMSEIGGRMAGQIGAHLLEKPWGGKGVLLGGVPGVAPGKVVILGGGIAGTNALQVALGLGAQVSVIDIQVERLRTLQELYRGELVTLVSNPTTVAKAVAQADLVIGAVLVPGARAPRLITRQMVSSMAEGSVIIDLSVDQGGCVETCHPTTHSHPTFVEEGVLHYCVTNIPGVVPRTATQALCNVTMPSVMQLARLGFPQAVAQNPALAKGVNTFGGRVTHPKVAEAHALPYTPLSELGLVPAAPAKA